MKITLQELRRIIREVMKPQTEVLTAFHTSPRSLSKLDVNRGMWFTLDRDLAKAYQTGTAWDNNKTNQHTYICEITGFFLPEKEVKKIAEKLGVNPNFLDDLTSNPPSPSDLDEVKAIIEATGADGFFHTDYHPIDMNKNSTSLFIPNPASCVKIIHEITDSLYGINEAIDDDREDFNDAVNELMKQPEMKSIEAFVEAKYDNDEEAYGTLELQALARNIYLGDQHGKGVVHKHELSSAPAAYRDRVKAELASFGLKFVPREKVKQHRGFTALP